ncbi:MAG TPA: FAD-binding protein [Acidimicrobiales bacterium]|nr:FAD-binding protein [Acidimicrobiales bacterium]
MKNDLDVLVIGTGVAGLSAAIELAGHARVAVVSKEPGGGGSTVLAQGGIAAATAPGDSAGAHAADTVAAAAGLGDPEVALAVTAEAADAVQMMTRLGARFDVGAPAKEGGHSAARVIHARGDATGAEISHALMGAASGLGIPVLAGMFLVDLLVEPASDGRARVGGALLWDAEARELREVKAATVILATGGYGQLWACTTSPWACSGDGLAAALRAGAQAADLEFAQFHPTGMALGLDPRPLASEALRGAGARLRDATGEYLHPSTAPGTGDLAPRDVVSRSMARRMAELGADHSYLDATGIDPAELVHHFPTFVAACNAAGLDPRRDWAPVSPTAHYTMGGVLTDTFGRTTLEGLMAVGEVGCSGLHGANRLASNSLLEGAVIGRRAAAVAMGSGGPVAPCDEVRLDEVLERPSPGAKGTSPHAEGASGARLALRQAMQAHAGVARDAAGLSVIAGQIERDMVAEQAGAAGGWGPAEWELDNMRCVARAVLALALRREESRGAHWRTDFPSAQDRWRVRQVCQLAADGSMVVGELAVPGGARVAEASSSAPVPALP